MKHLDELIIQPNYEKISNELPMDRFDLLINPIFEYTKELAINNAVELTSIEKEATSRSEDPLINFQRCLETQKRIFELAS
ncbi:hypothetical protein [Virgibacillus indicus]|nr:hypothetical protein [Virgibacillus indicus]